MSYKHLSITERELMVIHLMQGLSLCQIAKLLGRNKTTISRELARNPGEYLPSKAQARYKRRIAEQYANFGTVASRVSNRRKIPISHELTARPVQANERSRFGDREADTIVGFNRKYGLLTLVDRKSRFLICEKLTRLVSKEVQAAMIKTLRGQSLHTITPWRGREFQLHGNATTALGVEFYFPPPHQPQQRGTDENTNGLLREYFPKGYDFNTITDKQLQAVVDQLNHRPGKCLRTPAEVYFSCVLHLA